MSRILEINTPLGAENTVLTRFSGAETLGRLPEYRLTLVSKRGKLSAKDLLGKNVTAGVELPGGQEMRYFNGYITHFSEAGVSHTTWFDDVDMAYQYELTMHPWLWFLTRRSNFRIYQDMTVPDIVKQVCGDYPFAQLELKLTGSYPSREYNCQYRETDFNFVLRLLEQEGIYFAVKHENGKHTMVLFDANATHAPRPGYDTIAYDVDGTGYEQHEHIAEWSAHRTVQSGKYSLNDFDFKKPKVNLLSKSANPLPHDLSGLEFFDYPGEYEDIGDGSRYARIRLEEMQARHEVFGAAGSVRGIEAGCKFTLANHPDDSFNRDYLVTAATYNIVNNQPSSGRAGGGEFHCSFETIDLRTQFRPPRLAPRPSVQGPQTAIVVGPAGEEIHVDEHGRVKLQFQWDRYNNADENSSCWVRVSQPWSSKGWGALFLPRIGHEVIVEFIDGDPDRPIVIGRVNNADSTPPWPLPGEKTRSGFRTRTYKGGASNFNELSFDDKQGAEEIYLHAERNHVLRVKNNRIEEIGNESHMTVQKDVFVDLKADLHEKVTGDHNNGIDGSFSLKVAQDWQAKVGLKFAVDAGQEIHLKAGANVVIEAGASITLKVGGSFVTVHGGGVDIDGPLVKINSGGSPGFGSGAAPLAAKPPHRPRGSKGGTDMKPVKPKKPEAYSPSAAALQLAWKAAAPFCEQCQAASSAPPAPTAAVNNLADNASAAGQDLGGQISEVEASLDQLGTDLNTDGRLERFAQVAPLPLPFPFPPVPIVPPFVPPKPIQQDPYDGPIVTPRPTLPSSDTLKSAAISVLAQTLCIVNPLMCDGPLRSGAQDGSGSGSGSEPNNVSGGVMPPDDDGDDKPTRITNPKHHQNSVSPEPQNVDELYENSVVDKNGVRWAKDADGTIHRFSKPSNGETHWNGSTAGVDPIKPQNIPVEIRRLFGVK